MVIHPYSKLVLIGDSITDCDRARPVAEAVSEALGNGYVSLINGLLNATCPEQGIRIVNMGVSGNTVRDLEARWQTDVLDLKPDWLSILIGINDVWRRFDSRLQPEWHVPLDEYEHTLEGLVGTPDGAGNGSGASEPDGARDPGARLSQGGGLHVVKASGLTAQASR
jgi:lysophospholipase L1-like esterase